MIYDWRGVEVRVDVPLTPETSAYMLAMERAGRRLSEHLARDLFGSRLVDQHGREIRSTIVADGGLAIQSPITYGRA